jgi:predicted MPP superfamily phosphohydrolase
MINLFKMNKIKKRLIYLSFPLYLGTIFYYFTLKKIFSEEIELTYQIIIYPLVFFSLLCITLLLSFDSYHKIFNFFYLLYYLIFGIYVNLSFPFSFLFLLFLLKIQLPFKLSLFVFPFSGIILTIYGIINSFIINIERIKIKCENLKCKKLTICHLTDLHLGSIIGKELIIKLVNIIKKEKNLDLIIITGDIVDGTCPLSKEIFYPFQKIKIPIYYINGNHEEYAFLEEMKKLFNSINFIHLSNKTIQFNNIVNLIGVDYDYPHNKAIQKMVNILPNNSLPNILLYHVPIFRPFVLKNWNIFLMLCGHTHGGQFFPIHLLQFYYYKILDGLYHHLGKYYVYCSSGVGTTGPPMRTFCQAKIGIITLENEFFE